VPPVAFLPPDLLPVSLLVRVLDAVPVGLADFLLEECRDLLADLVLRQSRVEEFEQPLPDAIEVYHMSVAFLQLRKIRCSSTASAPLAVPMLAIEGWSVG